MNTKNASAILDKFDSEKKGMLCSFFMVTSTLILFAVLFPDCLRSLNEYVVSGQHYVDAVWRLSLTLITGFSATIQATYFFRLMYR